MVQQEIEKLLDASTHHVRYWVENLEPLSSKPRVPRHPTNYTAQEVLFLAVVRLLDDAGVTWKALASISEDLFQLIRLPQEIGQNDELVLWKTRKGWQFVGKPEVGCVTVHVPMAIPRELVRKGFQNDLIHIQGPLNLGVAAIRSARTASK